MSGSVFALLCALSFSFSIIVARRALTKNSEVLLGVFISISISLPFFLIILMVSGQLGSLAGFTVNGYVWLSMAGVLHFIVGRWFFFKSVQLSGANIASILRRIDSLVALFLGVTFLSEPLSFQLVAGVLLIVCGIVLTGMNPGMLRSGGISFSKRPPMALFFGFGTGLLWGATPILMKLGLAGGGSPVAGVFISFAAATVALSFSFLSRHRRLLLTGMSKNIIGLYCITGLLAGVANLFRFVALKLSAVSVVTPLLSTEPLILLVISFWLNRKLEVFNAPVVMGAIAVVVGAVFLV